jgi:UDP-GlcNAc:undecaprenyl-phosphate/decaprenyl-phosphate GlcNAc-1-phosphate transferase
MGAMDQPGGRKVHEIPIPRIGGVLIAFSFLVSVLTFVPITDSVRAILVGGMMISALGFSDDLIGVSARFKFLIQWLIAGIFLAIARPEIQFPLIGNDPIITWPIAAFIMVFLMNAINLQDGLDGLASGLVIIAGLCMGMFMIHKGIWINVLVLTALISSTIGFLRVNTWPAKIFMGDTGSYLLGFVISAVFVLSAGDGGIPLWAGLFFFAIPIVDTIQVSVNRLLRGQSMFTADKSHIHHLLLKRKISHKHTVYVEYMVASIFGLIPMLMISPLKLRWLGIGLIILLLIFFIFQQIMATPEWTGGGIDSYEWLPRGSNFRKVLLYFYLSCFATLLLCQVLSINEVTVKHGLLPAGLALGYMVWTIYRVSNRKIARISISIAMIVAVQSFIFHHFGLGIYDFSNPLLLIHTGTIIVMVLLSFLLFFLKYRDLVLIANPIEYFLIFGAILLLFLPVKLKAEFSTDLLGLELLAFFVVYRINIRLFKVENSLKIQIPVALSLAVIVIAGLLK